MYFFFFNDTATTEIYTLSLHDALPIWIVVNNSILMVEFVEELRSEGMPAQQAVVEAGAVRIRSEEHTSELQSRQYLVCRLLLEKKKKNKFPYCNPQHPVSRLCACSCSI